MDINFNDSNSNTYIDIENLSYSKKYEIENISNYNKNFSENKENITPIIPIGNNDLLINEDISKKFSDLLGLEENMRKLNLILEDSVKSSYKIRHDFNLDEYKSTYKIKKTHH